MSGYDPLLGFTKKTYVEILDDMRADMRAEVSPSLVLDAKDPVGQVLMTAADELAEVWEVAQEGSDILDPDNAEGANLTGVAALTGTNRRGKTRTLVTQTVTLLAGAVLTPATARANVAGKPTSLFRVREDYTAPGNETVDLIFESVALGPVEAFAGTLTEITVPVTGWVSTTNADDAQLGDDEETDPALRVRRAEELDRTGSANVDAVREDVDAVITEVFQAGGCTVLENTSDVIVDGMAPHSIEVIVYDGVIATVDDAVIAETIFLSKGAGIGTNGDISEIVLDRKNDPHEILFRRAVQRTIYFDIDATYDPTILTTPAQVTATVAAVKAAVVAVGLERRRTGLDVVRAPYLGAIAAVPGLVDVTHYAHAAGAPPGVGESVAPVTIPKREIAIVSSANVDVTLTAATEL